MKRVKDVYRSFAYFYVRGPFTFSETMAKYMPGILRKFRIKPKTLLDLACGDGRFAVIMAKKGIHVVGVDRSAHMLRYARDRARKERVKVGFYQQEMERLSMRDRFDLVTCWFDSLNYVLADTELIKTFMNVHNVLKERGFFVFDMNTIYGLSEIWRRQSSTIQQNTKEIFLVHHGYRYDKSTKCAFVKITGFRRQGRLWTRVEETHKERGYTLKKIRECLNKAELKERACWGDIRRMSKPKRTSGRVWFVVQKCS